MLHPTLFQIETLTLLRLSAIAGIDVRILYPGKSDSIISDQASQSYFTPLLKAGASIYSYKDGFMHAKLYSLMIQLQLLEQRTWMYVALN